MSGPERRNELDDAASVDAGRASDETLPPGSLPVAPELAAELVRIADRGGFGELVGPTGDAIAAARDEEQRRARRARRPRGRYLGGEELDREERRRRAQAARERERVEVVRLRSAPEPVREPGDVQADEHERPSRGPGARGGRSSSVRRAAKRLLRAPRHGRPIPYELGRRARRIAASRKERERWARRLPQRYRDHLPRMMTAAGRRLESAAAVRRTWAVLILLWETSTPRGARAFWRDVAGLAREHLCSALGPTDDTGEPIHANTWIAHVELLEPVLQFWQPRCRVAAWMRGPTGWAFHVYQFRPPPGVAPELLDEAPAGDRAGARTLAGELERLGELVGATARPPPD